MYQLFGLRKLLAAYAGIAAIIAVGVAMQTPDMPIMDWRGPASTGAAIAAFIVWLFGETPLFPAICRCWPIGRFLPNIDGEWVGVTSSNWPRIQQRQDSNHGAEALPLQDVPVEVTIKARLLHVTMKLVSDTRYSESETLSVRLHRALGTGSDQIVYVYKNSTRQPKPTDEQSHLGAGCMDIISHRDSIELRGTYWTNRNWPRGLNTAGTITLRRKVLRRRR